MAVVKLGVEAPVERSAMEAKIGEHCRVTVRSRSHAIYTIEAEAEVLFVRGHRH